MKNRELYLEEVKAMSSDQLEALAFEVRTIQRLFPNLFEGCDLIENGKEQSDIPTNRMWTLAARNFTTYAQESIASGNTTYEELEESVRKMASIVQGVIDRIEASD